MQRLRCLGAVVAISVAAALTVIPPAGAHGYHSPWIEYCHYWPGLTEVHWDRAWLLDVYHSSAVVHVQFDWDGAIGPSLYFAWKGEENAEAATPIGSLEAYATLTLANGETVDVSSAECSK